MSDAIKILKDLKKQYSDYCNEYQLEDDNKFIDALDEALLALESQSSRVGQVAFLHQENQLLKKENVRLKKVDRFVVEVFNRLKERAEFDRARAETDLKILEKWKKNYLELVK